MKKLLLAAVLMMAVLSAGLFADETYPDWIWTGTEWVYTGDGGVDPIPPPPPIKN